MLCDHCKKKEATIHIKEVHGGKSVVFNFCADCAREKEESGELGSLGFNLAEMLFNLGKLKAMGEEGAGTPAAPAEAAEAAANSPRCPGCGWSWKQISEAGRLGCPDCYRVFAPMVADAIGRMQRGPVHLGKRPASTGGENRAALQFELDRLREELDAHIKREEYEDAAVCRDRIARLKSELDAPEKKTGEGGHE